MPNIDYNSQSKNYTKLNKRLAGYIKEIQLIFQQLNHEGCKIALDLTDILDNLDKVLDFSKYPQTKDRLNKLMAKYQKGISSVVVSSMQAEYKKGEIDQDTLANNLIERCNNKLPDSAPKLSKETSTIITSSTDKAKDSFLNRANRGFNLKSKLVLQSKEYIKELESAISVAIGKGTDAKTLSKQVTNLFLDYAKLDKEYKLKFGEPIPSKNIQYQAMRLARSEINMAYRDAEQARWRDMPFVLGYEIVLSNNHNCKGVPKGHFYDICDELAGKYPKDFKWLGWHPNCYHKDTKILTNNGWKLFDDVEDNDLIFSLNPNTKQTEWVKFTARQKYFYKGDMVRFYNRSLDCIVTPEHSMVYLDAIGNVCRKNASEFTHHDGSFILDSNTHCISKHFLKEINYYSDYVYDLTLEKNHIFYVSLHGKCFWGSNCRCHAVPIMMTDEQFIKWNNGKQVNAPTIDKMPKQFDKWLEQNKDRIDRATQRGTLPYFLMDNGVIKGGKFTFSLPIKDKPLSILEKAKIRHNNRTPEQIKAIQQRWDARRKENAIINKTANNLLKVAKNYPEVDITPITESIYSKQSIRRFANKTVAKEILKAKKDDIFLSNLIPNVRTWKKQFSSTELHSVYNAVESKLKQWDSLSLEDKIKKIDFEIKYLANPSLYKAGAKQYPTWEVAQSVYQKQLAITHYAIDIKSIQNNLSAAKKWSIAHPHSHKVANLLNEVDDLIASKSDLITIQQKAQLVQKTYNKRLK